MILSFNFKSDQFYLRYHEQTLYQSSISDHNFYDKISIQFPLQEEILVSIPNEVVQQIQVMININQEKK